MRKFFYFVFVVFVGSFGCKPERDYRYGDYSSYGDGKNGCFELLPIIREAAQTYGLEVGLLVGVIKVESNFNPDVESHKGAMGLMQITQATAAHFGCVEIFTVDENIFCGAKILKNYINRFNGNIAYGLAAYNTGPGRVKKYWKKGKNPPNLWYVKKVLTYRNLFRRKGCYGF